MTHGLRCHHCNREVCTWDTVHEESMRAQKGASPVSVHSDTVPSGRGAVGIREIEPKSRAGKVISKCSRLDGPDRSEWGE